MTTVNANLHVRAADGHWRPLQGDDYGALAGEAIVLNFALIKAVAA